MRRTLARFALRLLAVVLPLAGCSAPVSTGATGGDHLTSVGGTPRTIEWDGFVYARPGDDDAAIQRAIALQVKSSLGALREISIGISDLNAEHNLDPSGWTREPLTVVDPSTGAQTGAVTRVRYHYKDTALVGKDQDPGAAVSFTLLFGDYVAGAAALQPACVDEQTDADSLWYHYQPGQPACAQLISTETAQLNADFAKLTSGAGELPSSELGRRFLTVRAKLTPQAAAPTEYPEYDRLWGFGSDRAKVVVYAFVGVESDLHDSHDLGAIEYQRLLRTVRAGLPKLAVTYTNPFGLLLDYYVDGQKLDGVSFDDVARWMIDGTGYPAAVGSDATKIEALRQQVIANFSNRWIYWDVPATVTLGGQSRQMTVELRTFWGPEDDGTADTRQHAIWRYLEAFWYGDVFAYAGHSHFGHGPLEPTNYTGANFPDRYQVMLVNSCLSYNYYDLDFIGMHPEGSRDLEVVMNGLPAYWNGMGESTGKYLVGLLDGTGKSYAQILESMKIADPWGNPGYEPMRGVNGELDNVFDPTRTPLTVAY